MTTDMQLYRNNRCGIQSWFHIFDLYLSFWYTGRVSFQNSVINEVVTTFSAMPLNEWRQPSSRESRGGTFSTYCTVKLLQDKRLLTWRDMFLKFQTPLMAVHGTLVSDMSGVKGRVHSVLTLLTRTGIVEQWSSLEVFVLNMRVFPAELCGVWLQCWHVH